MCPVEKLGELILASTCIQVRFYQKNHKLLGTQKTPHPLTACLESDHGFVGLLCFHNTYKEHVLWTHVFKKRLFITT